MGGVRTAALFSKCDSGCVEKMPQLLSQGEIGDAQGDDLW